MQLASPSKHGIPETTAIKKREIRRECRLVWRYLFTSLLRLTFSYFYFVFMNALSMRDMIGAIFKSAHQKRRNGERGKCCDGNQRDWISQEQALRAA